MKKHFLSLGTKIVLLFFLLLSAAATSGMFFFMQDYAKQMQDAMQTRLIKTQLVKRLYQENTFLRLLVSESEKAETGESAAAVLEKQRKYMKTIRSEDEMSMAFYGDVIKDANKLKEQIEKMDSLGWLSAEIFFGIFIFLSVMWLVIRRLILVPTEQMIAFSQRFAAGDLSARILVPEKKSDSDEMDMLARNLNLMAQTIGDSLEKEKQRQRFLQNLLDSLPEGVRVIDENRNVVVINRTCRELFKDLSLPNAVKCYECVGEKAVCPESKNPCPFRLLEQNPDVPVKVIHSYTEPSGRDFYIEVSAKKLDEPANDGKRLVLEVSRSLDRDIRFSHTQKLSSLGLLAGSVAHELRNPLGAARLILENFIDREKAPSAAETDKYLKLILEQMNLCIAITERLLKLSRKTEKNLEPVDLNRIVSDTVSLLEYEAKKNGIEIEQNLSDDGVVVTASDPDMRMVFLNLMQNAFHAMPEGGRLSLFSSLDGDTVVIRVADTGCGISPENLNRIFEPFFSDGRPAGEGTGLGLSIVKNIIEGSGGKISVESDKGKGTVFEIRMKRSDQ